MSKFRADKFLDLEVGVDGSASEDETEDERSEGSLRDFIVYDDDMAVSSVEFEKDEDVPQLHRTDSVSVDRFRQNCNDASVENSFSAKTGERVRRFCLTLNNYSESEEMSFKNLPSVKYICYGREGNGVGRTPHLQAYVELDKSKRWTVSTLRKHIEKHQFPDPCRWHIEVARGTPDQNVAYCKKEGQFFESGVRMRQGKRSDLDEVTDIVRGGASMLDVARECPAAFIKYHCGIQKLITTLSNTCRDSPTLGYWCHGPTGSGKSRWAHSLSPGSTYVKEAATPWFCGYRNQETVVIDDYRPNAELNFSFLLRLVDRYPLLVRLKGVDSVQFNSRRVVVTSPVPIEEAFRHLPFIQEGDLNQLRRRFLVLEFGTGKLSHVLKLNELPKHPLLEE